MASLAHVNVNLTEKQIHKLMAGHNVTLKHGQMHEGPHTLHVHPTTAHKMHHAKTHGKGVRIMLTPHELESTIEGEGFGDFINKLKQGAKFVKEKLIDTPFYQQTLRPIAKQLVNKGIDTFVPEPARDIAHKAADFAGEKTSAFGLKPKKKKAAKAHHESPAKKETNELTRFVTESMMMPVPGAPGFTALPHSAAGSGIHHHHYYHHYYPMHHEDMHGRSFRLG